MTSVEQLSAGNIAVNGELTFETVPDLIANYPAIDSGNHSGEALTVDLSGVSKADSAGLALLVEWIGQARKDQISFSFANVPQQILAMAELCDLDEVLPLEKSTDKESSNG